MQSFNAFYALPSTLFLLLDLCILANFLRTSDRKSTKSKAILKDFILSVILQQLFAVLFVLEQENILILKNDFQELTIGCSLVMMTVAALNWLRYLLVSSDLVKYIKTYNYPVLYIPVIIMFIMCLFSYWGGYLFSFDENGTYIRGPLFYLQFLLPLLYILTGIYFSNKKEYIDQKQKQVMFDKIASFTLPLLLATVAQMYVEKGGLLSIGSSFSLVLTYLQVYLDETYQNEVLGNLAYDDLTGLLTMRAFIQKAQAKIDNSKVQMNMAVLEVRGLSYVNRAYGLTKGDELLCYLAEKIKADYSHSLLARKGDTFYCLVSSLDAKTPEGTQKFYEEVAKGTPVKRIIFNIGIYSNVDKSLPVSVLCDRCKLASKSIKNNLEVGIAYYDEKMELARINEQKMLLSFDDAIDNNEFVAYIQPKVSADTGEIEAGEALVRWIDKEGKFISPASFIPLFEKEHKVKDLDEFVYRKVCEYQSDCLKNGKKVVPISVNVSRSSLYSIDFVERYKKIASDLNVDLKLVPLEITESAATGDKEVSKVSQELIAAGFQLQMDDFGSGYSSLSSLATLPFSVVKLDKSLIDQISNEKGKIVIDKVIQTAHSLDMEVVAEGVESKEQAELLKDMSCELIQGFYYYKPDNLQKFDILLNNK